MSGKKRDTKRIYLDYAAATPVDPRVLRAMRPYFRDVFGNASAIHREGVAAARTIADARARLARELDTTPDTLTFAGSGTEVNNLALFGVIEALRERGRTYRSMEIVVSAIEHPSVLEPSRALARKGVQLRIAPVTTEGRVDVEALVRLITKKTVLVSVMYVNGEVGTVQSLAEIARAIRQRRAVGKSDLPYFHTDACQAPLWLPVSMAKLGVDLLTLDAQKIRGPKGIGLLVHRRGIPLQPQILGGGQERGLRSGTENTASIIGFAKALELAGSGREARVKRVVAVRDRTIAELLRSLPGSFINGMVAERVANNINLTVPGLDGELMVLSLDRAGIAASTKSACERESGPSHVLLAMGMSEEDASSSLRLTLGPDVERDVAPRVARALVELHKRQKRVMR